MPEMEFIPTLCAQQGHADPYKVLQLVGRQSQDPIFTVQQATLQPAAVGMDQLLSRCAPQAVLIAHRDELAGVLRHVCLVLATVAR